MKLLQLPAILARMAVLRIRLAWVRWRIRRDLLKRISEVHGIAPSFWKEGRRLVRYESTEEHETTDSELLRRG